MFHFIKKSVLVSKILLLKCVNWNVHMTLLLSVVLFILPKTLPPFFFLFYAIGMKIL